MPAIERAGTALSPVCLSARDPLGQLDDDSLRAADVTEPIDVLVVLHLADELAAAGLHGGDDGVDVVDSECDMADAQRVRRRVRVSGPDRGGVELHQLEATVPVRGLHHGVLHLHALEPDHAVDPTALDLSRSLQRQSQCDEERGRGLEVVDHDAHVLQALDRHALDGSGVTGIRLMQPPITTGRYT